MLCLTVKWSPTFALTVLCLTVKWWSKHLTSHFSLFQAQISEQTILSRDSQTIKVLYYIFHSPDILCGTNSLWIIIIEGVHSISVLRWPARPIQPSFASAQMALVTTRLRSKLNSPLSRLEEYRTLPYSLIDNFKTVLTQTLIHDQASYRYIIIVWSGHRQGSNQVFMLYSGSIWCCS